MAMYSCTTCYREFNEDNMVRNASGRISELCKTCKEILGKGPGYAYTSSKEFDEKWFEGIDERKLELDKRLSNKIP